MTIAELHGKLAPKRPGGFYERMEDLLTSDVFGTMKYAGWEQGFMDWLRSAQQPWESGKKAEAVLPGDKDIEYVGYQFWPTLKNGREPDLLIAIHEKGGSVALMMIEAKYLSGPSNFDIDCEFTVAEVTGDQIADQINDFPVSLKEASEKEVSVRIHIYLTAHFMCPVETFEDSRIQIRRHDVSYFWLNWQTLPALLEEKILEIDTRTRSILADLLDLFRRKELVPFKGFKSARLKYPNIFPEQGFWKYKWWGVPAIPKIFEIKGFWREI